MDSIAMLNYQRVFNYAVSFSVFFLNDSQFQSDSMLLSAWKLKIWISGGTSHRKPPWIKRGNGKYPDKTEVWMNEWLNEWMKWNEMKGNEWMNGILSNIPLPCLITGGKIKSHMTGSSVMEDPNFASKLCWQCLLLWNQWLRATISRNTRVSYWIWWGFNMV